MTDPAQDFVDPALAREHIAVLPQWKRDALAYRDALGSLATLDLPYGPRPRQRMDIFAPTVGAAGPVAIFLHGGYWQSMHRLSFSHLARGANAHGVTVVMVGYTLCPDATVEAIIAEVRTAVGFVSQRFGSTPTVFGHSAGGHLAACVLPEVQSALCISGIYDLAPLLRTPLNEKLRLDEGSAALVSPLRLPMPAGRKVALWVGETEPAEFHRQSREMADHLSASGNAATLTIAKGDGHFTVIAPLAEPGSTLTRELVALSQAR